MYCTTCGSKIQEGAVFCATCGTPVEKAASTVAPPRPAIRGPGAADLSADLKATVEARRELGPEMEDHLVESFLERLDERIEARVNEQVARRMPKGGASGRHGGLHNLPEPALVVGGSMALAIPLIGAAGQMLSVPIMAGVVLINLFYFLFRHH